MELKVVCIGGPTGAGKDLVVSLFLEKEEGFVRVPRITTRPARPGEIDGLHYFFLSQQDFIARETSGQIWAVDHFLGNRYGVDAQKILDTLKGGKSVIGIFGVCSLALRQTLPLEKTVLVYIRAPIELLTYRLIERGEPFDQMPRRIEAAKKQLVEEPYQFDHIIENVGHIDEAVEKLRRIVSA